MGEYLFNFNYISLKFNQLIWKKKTQGSKGLEDVYQWGNTSQNFVSAEPDTLDKADYIDWRLVQAINVGPILHSWY